MYCFLHPWISPAADRGWVPGRQRLHRARLAGTEEGIKLRLHFQDYGSQRPPHALHLRGAGGTLGWATAINAYVRAFLYETLSNLSPVE